MSSFAHSWDFEGKRDLGNFFDHFFIRSKLQPGWSAAQGGPGASSHTRELDTQRYLQRPCVMNPEGGPQQVDQAHIHNLRSKLALAEVDLARRKYYDSLKERAEIAENLSMLTKKSQVEKNWGWPFSSAGQYPREVHEVVDKPDERQPLFFEPEQADFAKKWDREPFGRVKFKDGDDDDHFKEWFAGVGYEDGYIQYKEKPANDDDAIPSGYYWTGPEKEPSILDQLLWKPLVRSGPLMVDSLGANKTVEAIKMGRLLEVPDELQQKRSLGHKVKFKDLKKGGYKETQMPDRRPVETNIEVRDPLTGVPLYSYKSKNKTVTNSKGHGKLELDVLVQRKKTKLELLEKQVDEFNDEIEDIERDRNKVYEKYQPADGGPALITQGIARDKVRVMEAKLDKVEKKKKEYEVRIDREKREIKAYETQIEMDDVGKGLPLPRALMYAIPTPMLEQMRQGAEILHIVPPREEEEKMYESPEEEESDDEDGPNWLQKFLGNSDRQKRTGMKNEKYFGKPLVDPATGRLDEKVVKRKNQDSIAHYKEINKNIADVFLSRSDGTSRFNKTNNVAPHLRQQERAARADQQKVVDALMVRAINNDNHLKLHEWASKENPRDLAFTGKELEKWAKAEDRKESTFGSSMFEVPKAILQEIVSGDGEYLKIRTFVPPPQVKEGVDAPSKSAVPAKCSSGKVLGGGKQMAQYELLGWGPEEDDFGMCGGSTAQWYPHLSAQNCVTANTMFAGRRANPEDKEKGPFAPTIIHERKWNGTLPGQEKSGGGLGGGKFMAAGAGLANLKKMSKKSKD